MAYHKLLIYCGSTVQPKILRRTDALLTVLKLLVTVIEAPSNSSTIKSINTDNHQPTIYCGSTVQLKILRRSSGESTISSLPNC